MKNFNEWINENDFTGNHFGQNPSPDSGQANRQNLITQVNKIHSMIDDVRFETKQVIKDQDDNYPLIHLLNQAQNEISNFLMALGEMN